MRSTVHSLASSEGRPEVAALENPLTHAKVLVRLPATAAHTIWRCQACRGLSQFTKGAFNTREQPRESPILRCCRPSLLALPLPARAVSSQPNFAAQYSAEAAALCPAVHYRAGSRCLTKASPVLAACPVASSTAASCWDPTWPLLRRARFTSPQGGRRTSVHGDRIVGPRTAAHESHPRSAASAHAFMVSRPGAAMKATVLAATDSMLRCCGDHSGVGCTRKGARSTLFCGWSSSSVL